MPDEIAFDRDERLWGEGKAAFRQGDSQGAIEIFKRLADAGDWRASASVGYIFESDGTRDKASYVLAENWYSRSLSQEENPLAHRALARYHYFGLGGSRNLGKAFEHLQKVPLEHDAEVALMLGEMYFHGEGVGKDIEKARSMFTWLAERGLPVGHLGLARVERACGNWSLWFIRGVRGLFLTIRLVAQHGSRDHPSLLGLGGTRGRYWLTPSKTTGAQQ